MAEYPDVPYLGPPRWYGNWRTDKKYVAIHNTANDATAREEASYATRRADSTSSHYYVDAAELVQSLHTDLVAWHAGNQEGNYGAIAYEITGVNAWTRQQWLDRVAWAPLVRQIVRDCVKHRIDPRWLTIDQMQAGNVTGLVTHNDMRLAWAGTDHTDPGPNFPKDHLIALVQSALNGDDDMANLDTIHYGPDGHGRSAFKLLTDLHDTVFWSQYAEGFPESVQARLAAVEAKLADPVDEAALAQQLAERLQPLAPGATVEQVREILASVRLTPGA